MPLVVVIIINSSNTYPYGFSDAYWNSLSTFYLKSNIFSLWKNIWIDNTATTPDKNYGMSRLSKFSNNF